MNIHSHKYIAISIQLFIYLFVLHLEAHMYSVLDGIQFIQPLSLPTQFQNGFWLFIATLQLYPGQYH